MAVNSDARWSAGSAEHMRRIILGLFNPMPDGHAKGCLHNDPHIHPHGPCICGYAEVAGNYLWALREAKKIAAEGYGQKEVDACVRMNEPSDLVEAAALSGDVAQPTLSSLAAMEQFLSGYFWTGEPGRYDAIKAAAKELMALASQPPAAPDRAEWAINGAHEFAESLKSPAAPVETKPITTEELDKLQFGRVLHSRSSAGTASELLARAQQYLDANAAESGADVLIAELIEHIRAAPQPTLTLLSPDNLPKEGDPDVLQVARAIAERGIGRFWDDFPETDAFDTDQGDLIEYARAAVEIFRRSLAAGIADESKSAPTRLDIAKIIDPDAAWGKVVETGSPANERILAALAKADDTLAMTRPERGPNASSPAGSAPSQRLPE